MKKAMLIAIAFVGFATISCKKDKGEDKKVTSVDLITSTTWKIDTIGFDMDKNGVIDAPVTGGYATCEADNTLTFNSDSTGLFDEGASKCEAADAQSTSFKWQFKSGDSVINIQGNVPGDLQGDVKVLALSNTNLTMAKNLKSAYPIPYDIDVIIALQK